MMYLGRTTWSVYGLFYKDNKKTPTVLTFIPFHSIQSSKVSNKSVNFLLLFVTVHVWFVCNLEQLVCGIC